MNKKIKFSLILSIIMLLIASCAHKTITEQILSQTNDPKIIMYATYADALTVYKNLQDLYMPYINIMEKSNPDLHNKIIEKFSDANNLLKKWKQYGNLTFEENESFREVIRKLSFDLARVIDEKLK